MPSNASFGMPGDGSPGKAKFTFNKDTNARFLAGLRENLPAASLRPYTQQKKAVQNVAAPATRHPAMDPAETRKLIGKPIVPWSSLDWQVSPKKATIRPKPTVRPTHKRTVIPVPAHESPAVLQPLRPANINRISTVESIESSTPVQVYATADPSSQTFGSEQNAKVGREPSVIDYDEAPPPSPSPPFKRVNRHSRKSSVLSAMCDSGAVLSAEAIKSLGLSGTLGGKEPEIDPEDPDSDIPDELQSILSGQSDDESVGAFDDTLSYGHHSPPPTPGLPPLIALPYLQPVPVESLAPMYRATLTDEDANEADVDEGDESPAEDDTSKSFDFTGELRKLNNSGGYDRRSFVEQLETAFRTPARVDLGFSAGQDLFAQQDTPPATSLPPSHRSTPGEDVVPQSVSNIDFSSFTFERSIDESEQSYRDSATSDTFDRLLAECEDDFCRPYPEMQRNQASVRPKESDGKLNRSFKFGGKVSIPDTVDESFDRPLTLSDIIPPLSCQSMSEASMVEEDSSVMQSIMGKAYEDDASVVKSIMAHATDAVPAVQPRARVDSNTSSKRRVAQEMDISRTSSHSRNTSEASFTGFESFDEVRRAFEFGPNRPTFYPPPGATSRVWHGKDESIYSIASVSSFGAVLNQGARDPFGYAASRPVSYDMSTTMSTTVDDTFSFLKKKNPIRARVDSDASSFYFQGAGSTSWRGHRRDESSCSMYSNTPPISMYNRRSYHAHRRNDSNTSANYTAQSFAPPGSYRPSWTRHRQEPSTDSIMSDYSVARLGRPGVGDKMFDMDYGMPLEAISASPSGSRVSDCDYQRSTYDSIFDTESKASAQDSIFEKTDFTAGQRTSFSEDIFDLDRSYSQQDFYLQARQFRPISMLSTTSMHTAPGEDDTMISVSLSCCL